MAYPIVKEIIKKFNDKRYFVFRNFPLSDIHPHAHRAAEAAEASAAQNKFWQMHDYLFEHQDALDDIHLSNYAKKMDLDIGKFKKEMSGHVYASLIDNSLKSGIDSGVEGTPTFFVNGVRYEDSWDLDTFSKFLKKTLKRRSTIVDNAGIHISQKFIFTYNTLSKSSYVFWIILSLIFSSFI
jgi:protein-disulfide isomerase